jgi:hypothetical protein
MCIRGFLDVWSHSSQRRRCDETPFNNVFDGGGGSEMQKNHGPKTTGP